MTGLGGDSFWLLLGRARGPAHRAPGRQAPPRPAPRRSSTAGRGCRRSRPAGPLAALTVPGAADGLWAAHRYSRERLGSTVPWGDLLEAAIRHAADGVPVSPCQARVTARARPISSRREAAAVRAVPRDLSGRDSAAPAPGRTAGPAAAWRARSSGSPARAAARSTRATVAGEIGRACEALGSPLRAADLAAHRSRSPSRSRRRTAGGVAASVPPPCQGLVALAVLGMLDGTDVGRLRERPGRLRPPRGRGHEARLRRPGSVAGRPGPRAGAARSPARSGLPPGSRPADRDGPRRAGTGRRGHRARRHHRLRHRRRGRQLRVPDPEHLSRVGLGRSWRARRASLLQNRGAGFTLDAGHPNVLAPGKRPFHTLTPFMYLRDGKPALVAGTMGGEGQPQTLVAVATRVLDVALDVQAAVEAPRWVYGRTWGAPTRALAIEGRFGEPVTADLARRGHDVRVLGSWSDTAGHAQALELRPGRAPGRRRRPARRRARPRLLGRAPTTSLRRTPMSQPVRVTLEAAKVAPIPPGSRSALLMQHGSMKLRYYAPRGPDAQTPHDQDELYVVASGPGHFRRGQPPRAVRPGDVLFAGATSSIGSRGSPTTSQRGSCSTARPAASPPEPRLGRRRLLSECGQERAGYSIRASTSPAPLIAGMTSRTSRSGRSARSRTSCRRDANTHAGDLRTGSSGPTLRIGCVR